jgi:AcrR family transcriptional regulator
MEAKKKTRKAPASLGREAWIAAACEVLAREGLDGVRVEPLAAKLGVTKGSFYWHFRDRAALLDALLEDWEMRATSSVIVLVDASSDSPAARLTELLRRTTSPVPGVPDVEHAIRAWGTRDPDVMRRLAAIDRRRERYVEDLLVGGGVDRSKAKHRARALYLVVIGEHTRVAHGGRPTSAATWAELLGQMLKTGR